jgi:hypothetical protein
LCLQGRQSRAKPFFLPLQSLWCNIHVSTMPLFRCRMAWHLLAPGALVLLLLEHTVGR